MKKNWSVFLFIILLIFPIISISLPIINETQSNTIDSQINLSNSLNIPQPDFQEIPQPMTENWTRIFGSTQEERISSGFELADGSLAFCGRTFSRGAGGSDGWFVRTDSLGNVIWDLVFGGTGDEYLISMIECANGDFVLAGYTSTYGPGDHSVWLLRTDSNANPLWNKTFGGPQEDKGYDVLECSNGDLLITGYTKSFSIGDSDCWIIRTDSLGNHLWNQTYGSLGLDGFWTAQEVSAGGFIFSGECEINQVGNRDIWLMKTDSLGVVEWNVTFGGAGRDRGVAALEYGAGYAILGTANYTIDLGDSDYWLIITNSTGDLLWQQFYGGPSIERAQNMVLTNRNGFALFGYSYSYGSGVGDLWLVITDSNGIVLDTFVKGGSLNDYGRSVVQCANGDFLLTGDTYSFGAGDWDAWLIRVLDVNFEWDPTPVNQFIYQNQNFYYDLNVTPEAWIDVWEINYTTHFTINSQGIITNVTSLSLGPYGILVRVNSTYGDILETTFTLTVLEIPIYSDWTMLVYLDGDNDLEEYAFDDFNTMETIGSTADIRILVYVDFWTGSHTPFTGARCYEITQDNNPSIIASTQLPAGLPSEPNMGQWQTLRDFIVFGQTYAPADHYLLTLWNHGAGAYGLCTDDTSRDRLTISELEQALNDPLVQHLDIVAFDACLMGQLEVAYEIRDATDIVVFSEESVPLTGFPYEDILLNLTTFPNSGPKTVASSMVYYYVTAYDFDGRYYDPLYNDICLSAIETSKLSSVAMNLDQLVKSLEGSASTPLIYETFSWARSTTQGFTWADFIDLNSFATSITSYFSSASPIYQWAVNLSTSIQACVFEEMHLAGLTDASGLGAVFASYEPYQLALANDTDWDDFIEAFIDVGSSPDNALELLPNLGIQSVPTLHCGYLNGSYDSVFFEFTPTETGRHFITLEAAWDKYDTDFDLYIYDIYENLLDSSTSTDSSESIAISLNAGDTYYIEVYSYPGAYDGIGVFYLNVNPPSSTGLLPIDLIILLIVGATIGIIIGVVALVIFLLRRSRSLTLTSRYTRPTYVPPRTTEPTGAPKFCAYCGAVIPQGARYCPICGSSVR
ncbi:MAG: clostripain-related cysteine peptidase [Promethearchaeota archaeon]